MVIIPIVFLGICFYSFYLDNYISNHNEKYNIQLKNISTSIVSTFYLIENDILLNLNHPIFYDYKRMSKPGEYVEELRNLSSKLGELRQKYSITESVYYYDPHSNAILTDSYGTYDMDDFYDTSWIMDFDMSKDLKRYDMRVNKNEEYLLQVDNTFMFKSTENVITIAGKGYDSKLLAINISVAKFSRQISESFGLYNENFYLIDSQGLILLCSDNKKLGQLVDFALPEFLEPYSFYYENENDYIFYHNVPYNNLVGVFVVSKAEMLRNFLYFIQYILILSATLFIICMFLAFIISKKMYSPMKSLILSINKFGNFEEAYSNKNVKDVIDIFRMVFTQLHGDKEILQNKITIYEISVRNYIFKKYLEEKEEINNLIATFKELNIGIDDKLFEFVIIRISEDSLAHYTREEALNRLNIIDVLDGYICSIATSLFMDIEKNMYMAFITSENAEQLKDFEYKMIDAARNAFGLDLSIGISDSFDSLERLRTAYRQGLKANEYAHFFGLHNRALLHQDISSVDVETLPFPINAEIGILKNIIFKNTIQARDCIHEIIDYIRQVNDIDYAKIAFNRLLSTIDKEFPLLNMDELEPFSVLAKIDNLNDIEKYFTHIIEKTINQMIESEDKENCYSAQAKQYINDNASQIINVTDIASHINISYPYLSKLFKEHTGMNVLDYLNTVRIEKSKNMLHNTNENLQTISEVVGYSNIQSFQRFFRKFELITPGEYRKIYKNSERKNE